MYFHTCVTMPRKSVSKKTEQYPLLPGVQPDDLSTMELPVKKGATKKEKESRSLPSP